MSLEQCIPQVNQNKKNIWVKSNIFNQPVPSINNGESLAIQHALCSFVLHRGLSGKQAMSRPKWHMQSLCNRNKVHPTTLDTRGKTCPNGKFLLLLVIVLVCSCCCCWWWWWWWWWWWCWGRGGNICDTKWTFQPVYPPLGKARLVVVPRQILGPFEKSSQLLEDYCIYNWKIPRWTQRGGVRVERITFVCLRSYTVSQGSPPICWWLQPPFLGIFENFCPSGRTCMTCSWAFSGSTAIPQIGAMK